MEYGTGAIRDSFDSRDHQWGEVAFGAAPFNWGESYDIEKALGGILKVQDFKIDPKDQDGSGSCGGQAWAYYDASIEGVFTGSYEERSARFIYAQTAVPGGGSAGRDNAEVLVKQGCATERTFTSYENGKPPSEAFMQRSSDITEGVRDEAKKARALSYANVPTDIDTVAQAIRDCHGVILGITGENNGTWTSEFPLPPIINGDNATRWRHWVYAGKAKIIGGKKYIGFINSWGDIGNHGWQWISEDYFNITLLNDMFGGDPVWQCWTHLFNPESVPQDFHYSFTNDLEYGMKGPEVKKLQTALQILGFFPVSVKPTEYFGTVTREAVKKFQFRNLIAFPLMPGYGRCGPKTRAKLNSIFA